MKRARERKTASALAPPQDQGQMIPLGDIVPTLRERNQLLDAIAAMEAERGRAWPGDAERRVYELARAMRPEGR